ncbi:hypothetical protein SAMD00023353_1401450 [Rosellinia necatrix]|uniref:Uncharacterized protein n=1 Tax=Rosellinia necatrix TaxID=77044 RepID=A0A1S8A6Z0_ROSNE|nr:hypothetical protein SAMD00023353_1401450 [Rosellinia necatrix]
MMPSLSPFLLSLSDSLAAVLPRLTDNLFQKLIENILEVLPRFHGSNVIPKTSGVIKPPDEGRTGVDANTCALCGDGRRVYRTSRGGHISPG